MKVPYSIPVPNNMGMVRYLLAFAVVVAHFNGLVGADIRFPFTSYTAVGGFFALSGFLIYGSYLRRRNLRAYIVSRMVRLLPAYFFIVLSGWCSCRVSVRSSTSRVRSSGNISARTSRS